jgi:general secretion pathway protein L
MCGLCDEAEKGCSMAEYQLVRFFSGEDDRLEWSVPGEDAPFVSRIGSLEEFKGEIGRNPVALVLPAAETLLTTARLPATSERNIAAALPFVVEEQFADSVEHLYFSHGRRDPNGEIPLAAIQRELLDERLQKLDSAGIRISSAVPETLLLPQQNGHWVMLAERDCLVLRYGPHAGFGVERSVALTILSRLLAERAAEEPPLIQFWASEEEAALIEQLRSLGLAVERMDRVESGFQVFEMPADGRPQLDLMRDVERHNDRGSFSFRSLWPAAAMLLLALAVHIGVSSYRYWSLGQEQNRIAAEMQQLFKSSFPEVERVVDPLAQAKQLLKKRRQAHGQGADPLLDILYQMGGALRGDASLRLTGLDYEQGVVRIQMRGKTVARIERFKQRLEKGGGVEVEILSAESREGDIDARLRIRRQAS